MYTCEYHGETTMRCPCQSGSFAIAPDRSSLPLLFCIQRKSAPLWGVVARDQAGKCFLTWSTDREEAKWAFSDRLLHCGVGAETLEAARKTYWFRYAGFLDSILGAEDTVVIASLSLLKLDEKCACGRIWDGQAQCMCNLDDD